MRRQTTAHLALAIGGLAGLTGCATREWTWATYPHRCTETLAQDREDHREYVNRIAEQDLRALGDDLDLIFMTDRPTRLTRWTER